MNDNQNYNAAEYAYKPEPRKRSFVIPIAIVIAGLFVGGALFFSRGGFGGQSAAVGVTGNTPSTTATVPPVSSNDHILGNPNAPIVIVEYSDTECPFCKTFHETMHKIINEYGTSGKVAWVYRHFPLDVLHKKARKEAEATECAFDQGGNNAFWKYIDLIFKKTPSNDGLDLSLLPKFAEDIHLDKSSFESCLLSGRHTAKIAGAFDEAIAAGASGTPTSFLFFNGQSIPVEGAQSFASVTTLIEGILAQIKPSI
ncbi:MAG: DSBA oxidoreductase [Parcubacteria group bacterium Gr01-1014_48]|nr:MAG: DSBA oxidoreductase [Parcubacteria group bacterium Greene0416_14]TSC72933.1 MAG: DSBA oxidoreductase [Parcubacteria group bacterium Gr01-1014_48]TSD01499.1 MAG: DSBA oxidoreductase [Parcubacteria group bacterium Greene1014_15]TSD08321.1 MAG: DSBA oxidoreductase [Parcubacteria group bacterium Greene0714_4]